MMGGGAPPPSGQLDGDPEPASEETSAHDEPSAAAAPGFQMPAGLDFGNIMNA